jgi:glycosyltransferase involved in cell wall biosynthesis
MNNVIFSIIIPAYNAAPYIKKCIESIKSNDNVITPYEIVVVDNGSIDGTGQIVKGLGMQIIENTEGKRKSIAALRNCGAKIARGNILVFLDADMIVPENWLQKANELFSHGFEGMLGFIEKTPPSAGWVGKVWGNPLRQNRNKTVSVDFLDGRNLFINRSAFEKTNGFNETLITAEDKDLTFRVLQAGFKAISVPDVSVIHLGYEKNLCEFMRKEFWRQGSTLQLARQWGFSLRTLKNPVLSLWHIIVPFTIVFSIIFFSKYTTLFLVFLWMFPSSLLMFFRVGSRNLFSFLLPLFFLTFLRWHVSGLSVIVQLIKGIR